nr:hypothetical protein CFP56_51380 [Quercus suber]
MREPPQHENPEENAHEKIRGEWTTVVKSEQTSEEFAAVSIGRDPAEGSSRARGQRADGSMGMKMWLMEYL